MEGFEDHCAAKLQAAWRRFLARRLYCLFRFPMYHIAAMQIQFAFRSHLARKRRRERPSSIREAALMLQVRPSPSLLSSPSPLDVPDTHPIRHQHRRRRRQAAWRAYANRKIYRYYRDLISFRMAGDPRVMLRVRTRAAGAAADGDPCARSSQPEHTSPPPPPFSPEHQST